MILTIVGATAIAISTSKIILAGSKVGPTTPRRLAHVYDRKNTIRLKKLNFVYLNLR